MKFFSDLPIRHKMSIIVLAAIGLSYVIFALFGYFYLKQHPEVQALSHYMALSGALLLLVSGFNAWWLYRVLDGSVAKRIVRLNRFLRHIDVDKSWALRATYQGEDEVGELVLTLNYLLEKTCQHELRHKRLVAELHNKSAELEERALYFEEHSKAIHQLFSGASHDLRQPLQAMTIFIASLKQSSKPEQLVLVNKLDSAVENLNYMFTDLLDVSTLESRIEKVSFSPISMTTLLERVSSEFSAVAAEQGLTLRFHIRDVVVESNDTMLERIVRNLLSNAIRYTQKGGVLLACRARADKALIEIWDTGSGIPEAKRKAIFEQFVQLDKNSSEAKQGFGLGLSIVKRLNDLLGHHISVHSREGYGTLFRIEVPLYRQRKRSVNYRASSMWLGQESEAQTIVQPVNTEALSVILVDDDDQVREALEALLNSWGMTVITFASVSAIWDFYAVNTIEPVDLIVSDFQLSRSEDAFDAIAILRANHVSPVPAIIISGTDDEAIIQEIKESEFTYLKKPVVPAKLRALMQYVMNQSAAG